MLLGSSGSPFHAVLVGSNDIPAAISLMDRTHQSPRLTTILHPRKTQMDHNLRPHTDRMMERKRRLKKMLP